MTRPEPRFPGPMANTLPTRPIYIYIYVYILRERERERERGEREERERERGEREERERENVYLSEDHVTMRNSE